MCSWKPDFSNNAGVRTACERHYDGKDACIADNKCVWNFYTKFDSTNNPKKECSTPANKIAETGLKKGNSAQSCDLLCRSTAACVEFEIDLTVGSQTYGDR